MVEDAGARRVQISVKIGSHVNKLAHLHNEEWVLYEELLKTYVDVQSRAATTAC